MRIPMYQVDAFASRPFAGNPAAICPLEAWLDDEQMQSIAFETSSETAFFVPDRDGYALRWFTPALEVDLCGHCQLLASALRRFSAIWRRSGRAFSFRLARAVSQSRAAGNGWPWTSLPGLRLRWSPIRNW